MKIKVQTALFALLLWAAGSGSAMAQTSHNINTGGSLTITSSNSNYIISGNGTSTSNRITVQPGLTNVNITLSGVNIDVSGTDDVCAFDMSDATVYLTLNGSNYLKSGKYRPGLQAPEGATLEIKGSGSLEATGGISGAGIGGMLPLNNKGGYGGNITISGGTVKATGGQWGAGIGGGQKCGAGIIKITGGTVTAQGGLYSAGIGSSANVQYNAGSVYISGGTVTATGDQGQDAMGIGSGAAVESGGYGGVKVFISGGMVTSTGGNYVYNNQYAKGEIITGGSVRLIRSTRHQPTNSEYNGTPVYLNTITVGNPTVNNAAVTAGSINGIACTAGDPGSSGEYGIKDVKTDNSGKVYFYLPASSAEEPVKLTANGNEYSRNYKRETNNSNVATLVNRHDLVLTSDDNGGADVTDNSTYTSWGSTLTLIIIKDGNYTLSMNGVASSKESVKIKSGVKATVKLNNVTIANTGVTGPAIFLESGADLTLTLVGTSTLAGSNSTNNRNDKSAGIYTTGATLRINGTGTLYANGTMNWPGIGGNPNGTVIIDEGTVIATGGNESACIGGSKYGENNAGDGGGGYIIINGGTVTAKDDNTISAGIGGGKKGGCHVTINGGTVKASANRYRGGSGIGSGYESSELATIIINGGTIEATGDLNGYAGSGNGGAGIGGGEKSAGANITINGGNITATGGPKAAGIGGGSSSGNAVINITGGNVTATVGSDGVGIGDGYNNSGGSIKITGGSVKTGSISPQPANGSGTPVYLNTLTVGDPAIGNDIKITAGRIGNVACVDGIPTGSQYGIRDVYTRDGGKVYFYLPATAGNEAVSLTANGTEYRKSYKRETNHNNAQKLTFSDLIITDNNNGNAQITDINTAEWIGDVLTVKKNGSYTIAMQTGVTVTNVSSVKVNPNLNNVNITLQGVNIDASATGSPYDPITDGDFAFDIAQGSTVALTLSGTNILKSGYVKAGLHVPSGAAVTMAGSGNLTATGGYRGAGIGGRDGEGCGTVTVNSGTVTATSGYEAAGIGGGFNGTGGTITITGGNVTATALNGGGAGIGGGRMRHGGTINISGGTVIAASAAEGAGIGGAIDGGSVDGDFCTINISGGTVTATAGSDGAGIGGGKKVTDNSTAGGAGTITISGGTVTATGGSAGIGNGGGGTGGTVTVTGGSVKTGSISPQPVNGAGADVYLNSLTVGSPNIGDNKKITAGRISGVACVDGIPTGGAYGIRDVYTRDDGKVYFYLPATGSNQPVSLTANSKVYGRSYTRTANHLNSETLPELPPYAIELSETGTHDFGAQSYGYSALSAATVTVSNTGSIATGALTVSLGGNNPSPFTVSGTVSSIEFGSTGTFTVQPNTGLSAGTYRDTVTVSGSNGITASFEVKFTVNKIDPAATHLAYDLTDSVTYNGTAQSVAVALKTPDYSGMGAITVKYNNSTTTPVNAGTYPVTVSIADGMNFNATPTDLSLGNFTIKPLEVAVSADDPGSVTYGSAITLTPTFTPPLISTDTHAGAPAIDGQTSTAGHPVAGNHNIVQGTLELSANYKITGFTPVLFTVTPKPLPHSVTPVGKIYDGTDVAHCTGGLTAGDIITGDVVQLDSAFTFPNKHVTTTGGTVTATTWNLTGADSANYALATFGAPTADITAMAVTVTMNNDTSIVYGQAVKVPGYTSTLSPLYHTDTFTGAPAVYSTAADLSTSGHLKAATYDIVKGDLNINDGNSGNNYTVTFTPASGYFTVTPKPLSHSVTPVDKIYDGTDVAHCTGGLDDNDIITNDIVQLDSAFTFPNKNVIAGGTVTADTWNLSGADAANYALETFGVQTADITAMAVTVTMNNKDTIVYGQSVAVPGYTSSLVPLYDNDTFTGAPAVDSTAANDLSTSGYLKAATYNIVQENLNIDDGNSGNNYTITFTPAPDAFTVIPKPLSHDVAPVDKIYDGTDVAHCTGGLTAGDIITGDAVQLDSAFTFPNKNVTTGGTVTANPWRLTGADSANYALATFGAPTADITAMAVTVTMNNDTTIVYGQAVKVPGYTSTLVPLYDNDAFTGAPAVDSTAANLSSSGNLKAGTYNIVREDLNIDDGNSGNNYNIIFTPAVDSFTVTKKPLSHDVTPVDKIYDGTDVAHCTGGLTAGEIIAGDAVQLDSAFTFTGGKNVIANGTVTANPWRLTGADSANYALAGFGFPTADIWKKNIDITGGTVTPKTYDGNDIATVTALTFFDPVVGESLDLDTDYKVSAANFDNADVATNKTVTITAALEETIKAKNYHLNNGTNYTGLKGNITKTTPAAVHLDFDLTPATYDSTKQVVAVALDSTKYSGMGTITVMYNGSTIAPIWAGDYVITVDVDEGANFTSVDDLLLGTFSIGKATPSETFFDFAQADAVYDALPHGATVDPLATYAAAGLRIVAVKYEGVGGTSYPLSDTVPTGAGTYVVRITTAESANFAAVVDFPLDTFEIAKAVPTAEHLNITANTYVYYNGNPHTVDVPTLRATYTGLGDVTVKYNGSDRPPVYPGEYAITLDIADGTNFAAVGDLPVGRLVISEPPTPSIPRRVTINPSDYFDLNPSPGIHHVESTKNMDITLTPRATLPEGYVPRVTTGRTIFPDDTPGNIRITANADGTYSVRIFHIIEEVVVTVTAVPDIDTGSEQPSAAPRVWSHGRRLYIAAPSTSGRAYIYNVSGRLVKIVSHIAGETVVTQLPVAGVHVVVVEGRSYLIMAN